MAKKKEYYVVIHGRRPGLYDRWFGEKGAAEQVDGLADAVYKGFYTLQEATEWLRELHAETIAGLPPDLVDLPRLHAERPRREGPSSLLKAGKILIYTDGGAIDNPGPGGYGVVLRYKGHRKEMSSGFRQTTNSRMELLACIEGLKALKRRCSVVLYSDSKYVVNGMTKGWAERWQAKGWKLSNDQYVKNADLWQQLVELCQQHDVEFRWVRSHSGNPVTNAATSWRWPQRAGGTSPPTWPTKRPGKRATHSEEKRRWPNPRARHLHLSIRSRSR